MEATKAGMHQVACDALAALHKALMESPGGCGSGHCEGDVLRVLVVCTELAAQSAAQVRASCATQPDVGNDMLSLGYCLNVFCLDVPWRSGLCRWVI